LEAEKKTSGTKKVKETKIEKQTVVDLKAERAAKELASLSFFSINKIS
jgi:hypothetical protein